MLDSVLSETSKKNIKILSSLPFVQEFYLAGGSGCALQLGHRISQDLDFFSRKEFSHFEIQESLKNRGNFIVDYSDTQTLVGRLNATKISFIHYGYPLIRDLQMYSGLNLASIEDIGCMKIDTISSRGKKRDFVDLYFILKHKAVSLKEYFNFFDSKYGPENYNLYHVLKSLVYFEDAEKDPDLQMLFEFSWKDLKSFFREQVKNFDILR
ncbi:MAG: nucleotidyl transferase AbiEii/AbiGii toxin family protein [Candidatus Aminicenantales bacterium]